MRAVDDEEGNGHSVWHCLQGYEYWLIWSSTIFVGTNCVPCEAGGTDGKILGECNESFGFGQKNLPQLQDHPPQGCGARDLHGSASQAAPRLIGKY